MPADGCDHIAPGQSPAIRAHCGTLVGRGEVLVAERRQVPRIRCARASSTSPPHLISAAPTRGATAAPVRPEVLPGSKAEVPPWPDRREDATASSPRGTLFVAPGLSARLGGEQERTASACGRLQCSASARRTGDNDLPIACRGGVESGPTRATPEVRIQCEGSREMAPVSLRVLSPCRPIQSFSRHHARQS